MAAEKIPGEFHRPSDAVEFYEHHMSDLSSLMKGEMAIYLNENTFYDADGVEVTNAARADAYAYRSRRSAPRNTGANRVRGNRVETGASLTLEDLRRVQLSK